MPGPIGIVRRIAGSALWEGWSRRRRLVAGVLVVAGLVTVGGVLVGAASADFLVGLFKSQPVQAESAAP